MSVTTLETQKPNGFAVGAPTLDSLVARLASPEEREELIRQGQQIAKDRNERLAKLGMKGTGPNLQQ